MPNRPLVAPQVQSISFDPAAAMQDVASIQINRQRMDEARRKSMEAMEVRQLAAQYPDDPDGFVNALQRVAPERAAVYSEKLWSGRREAALAHKAQTDASLAQVQAGIQLLQGATADTYKPRVDMLLKLSPELGQIIPADYDPQKLQGLFQVGQKTENFLKAQADAAALLADRKTRESVLTAFAGASNQQQWDANAKLFADAGLGSLVAATVGPQWSAEAQAAAAKNSISPEKQADDARLREKDAEEKRQFGITSGISAGHLAVSRAAETRLAKAAKEGGTGNEGLVNTVIADPGLWDQLTPTVKGQIAPLLREKGFEGFGKPLSEKATGQIADTRSAIDNLKELLDIMKKNEQYIGPLGGLQALNPYSEARKVQGDIARVRQRAGKRLEGGVLRKEDEIKYKEILGTILDAPDTAIYKTEGLINTLENDIKNYVNQQRLAGRRVTPQTGSSLPTERTTTGPQVGQTVTVRGKKVKITKVLPNGQFEGVAAQ